MRTIAILPVKSFARSKQRLGAQLSPYQRQTLAAAMFCDVLIALAKTKQLDDVLVVTAGSRPRAIAAEHGVRVLTDQEHGHNAAALVGIAAALQAAADRVLLVPGDCPALEPSEIDDLLSRQAPARSILIVPDRHGTGTNALVLTPPDALAPSFGPGSCERHAANARIAGVGAEVVHVPSLATDIDTPRDLETLEGQLRATEAGALTRGLIASLPVQSKC